MTASDYVRDVPGGAELAVLAQPRASRSKVIGVHDGQLKVAIAAPPVEGEANAALIEFLARWLKIPRREVTLLSGDTGRRKRFRLAGVSAADIRAAVG